MKIQTWGLLYMDIPISIFSNLLYKQLTNPENTQNPNSLFTKFTQGYPPISEGNWTTGQLDNWTTFTVKNHFIDFYWTTKINQLDN